MATNDKLSQHAKDYVLPLTDFVYNIMLVATVAKTVTIPAGAKAFALSCSKDVWVRFGGAAFIPVADVVDGVGCILNPAMRLLDSQYASMSLICAADAALSLEWFL